MRFTDNIADFESDSGIIRFRPTAKNRLRKAATAPIYRYLLNPAVVSFEKRLKFRRVYINYRRNGSTACTIILEYYNMIRLLSLLPVAHGEATAAQHIINDLHINTHTQHYRLAMRLTLF